MLTKEEIANITQATPEDVYFYSAGHKIRAFWYPPANNDPKAPVIVCGHGFSGMIGLQMVGVPEALSLAGYGVLTYYSRGIGESEGPRGRVIPREQVEDVRNAVTYVQARSDVDPQRVGVFGSAWGCSIAVAAAAEDERIKAVVGTVGIGDCERWLCSERSRWEWKAFLDRVAEDRTRRVLTGESEVVNPNEIHIPDHAASEARDKQWREFCEKSGYDGYPLETAEAVIEFKPEEVVGRIAPRAVMFVHMSEDMTVPPDESRSLYEKANEPKKLLILEGPHYDIFWFRNPTVFADYMLEAIDWFDTHVKGME
jgi:pimeloyl-ACP methyl ester carboxylesterase